MNKNSVVFGILALFLIVGIGAFAMTQYADAPTTDETDSDVRNSVIEFGTKLQMVPLLADEATVSAAMDAHYAEYVAPDLLSKWKNGDESRLGRYTSSPWPHRIEVVEVVSQVDGSYKVEGNIVEVTSSDDPLRSAAAVQPITLILKKSGDRWLITSSTKGVYSQIPHHETRVGFWECVPHKPGVPPTEECVQGIALDQSDGHLILSFQVYEAEIPELSAGDKVRVSGVVVSANQLSTMQWQKYDIDGIMQVTSIEKI